MGADQQEQNLISLLLENCSIIAGHIDTSAAGKFLPDRVVVEDWVMRIFYEKILAFNKADPNFFRKFFETFKKRMM